MLSEWTYSYTLEERTVDYPETYPCYHEVIPGKKELTAPRRNTAWSWSKDTMGKYTTSLLEAGAIAHTLQTAEKGGYSLKNRVFLLLVPSYRTHMNSTLTQQSWLTGVCFGWSGVCFSCKTAQWSTEERTIAWLTGFFPSFCLKLALWWYGSVQMVL